MTYNKDTLDLVNMNAYIKFGEKMSVNYQDIERKGNFGVNQGRNSGTNLRIMTCNNPKLDLAKMNAYIRFGEILPIGSQDIERKRNFCKNKRP